MPCQIRDIFGTIFLLQSILSRLMIFKSYALILTLFKQYFPMTPSLFHSSMLTHIREYEVLQAQTKHMPNKHFPMRVRIL